MHRRAHDVGIGPSLPPLVGNGLHRLAMTELPKQPPATGRFNRPDDPLVSRDFREHPVAGRHFGKMHVGLQADRFEVGDSIGGERVVEILSHRVGIVGEPSGIRLGRRYLGPGDGSTDSPFEPLGDGAPLDLWREFLPGCSGQDVVEVGEQGAECQSHREGSGGGWSLL